MAHKGYSREYRLAQLRAAVSFEKGYPKSADVEELERRAELGREKSLEQGGGIRCPGCRRR